MPHYHLTLVQPDSSQTRWMREGQQSDPGQPPPLHSVLGIFLLWNKTHILTTVRQKTFFPTTLPGGQLKWISPFSREQEQQHKKMPCPFNLCAHLWSWTKAYVLNNRGVREHMLNHSLQHHSDQKQSKPLRAIPRHKGSRLPLHIRRLCTTS